ncbi:MAG: RNA polymerase sigma-70 factor [Polaribacter sp.]|nr:RNA polymerase sigma-70 factor [Polaribacter sp.]
MPKENDRQLVSQLKKNEVKAFDKLFHKYGDKLYQFSFSLLKNEEDSKEIVQEVFFRIWNKRSEINCSKSFKSFIFTISYNLIIDQLRLRLKDKKYQKFLMDYFDNQSFEIKSETDLEILNKHIETAVEKIPEKRKQIYKLSRESGYSHKKIAQVLGVSVKTVENQINLSLKHIKLCLGKDLLSQ